MTFKISYSNSWNYPEIRKQLLEALVYLFPNEIKIIKHKIVNNEQIIILKNKIVNNIDINLRIINDNEFIKCIDVLKNNSYLIYVKTFDDYIKMQEIYEYIPYFHCYYCIINDELILINLIMYEIFFEKYKTIDVNTYLRSLKLNIMIE